MKIRPWLVAILLSSSPVGCGPSRPPADGDGGITAGKLGMAILVQDEDAAGESSAMVIGAFYREIESTPELLGGLGMLCPATTKVGSCGFYLCSVPAEGTNAGALTMAVEGAATATLAEPGSAGTYFQHLDAHVAEPGDRVTFSASGDEVPAFTTQLTMPGALTATLPTTISRASPLALTWSSTGAARTQIRVTSTAGTVACILDGSERSITIDPSLLALLVGGPGTIGVTAVDFDVVSAGDFRVLATVGQGTTALVTLE